MSHIRNVLVCFSSGDGDRQASRKTGVSRTAVKRIRALENSCGRARQALLELSDPELQEIFYPEKFGEIPKRRAELESLLPEVLKNLGRKHQSIERQWELYLEKHPGGFGYSWFCEQISRIRKENEVSMALEHRFGEAVFVDFAGEKLFYYEGLGAEKVQAELFVAILPASGYLHASALRSQKTQDFLSGLTEAFEDFGGVTNIVVSDCLKAAVKTAHRYESEIQPQMQNFARHFGTVVIPARPGHPQDKALVENAVNNLYRWVLVRLVEKTYASLHELNAALLELVRQFNERTMKRLGVSRRKLFEAEEKACLKPLPLEKFLAKEFQPERKVSWGYHVWHQGDKHWYSVPWRIREKRFWLLSSVNTVEIMVGSDRVATHSRSRKMNGFTTDPLHRPPQHQAVMNWTPENVQAWADRTGEVASRAMQQVIAAAQHPFLGVRSGLGLMSLSRKYGRERFLRALNRCLSFGEVRMRQVEGILQKGLDLAEETQTVFPSLPEHQNIRNDFSKKEESKC
jgi:transposase